ncbi:MAG: FAD-dependent thymidylate synthase [Acidimicrobiia bacterium]|nr:FAD-dependent thymidylate synthase [Acidimicrobiia bacterium]
MTYVVEQFTEEEAKRLAPYVTNLDKPVFALRNLPEVTKGALFARYSRSDRSLRRLLLDEFLDDAGGVVPEAAVGLERADGLYSRVLSDYGDDSVAQLGFAHVACEQVSNILTKVIERGRLAAYLEQSTRYITYDSKPGGRWRYALEPDIATSDLAGVYTETLDAMFETYTHVQGHLEAWLESRHPRSPEDPEAVWRRALRAKACDATRGLLPAATVSNVGMAASGQAFESLLLHLLAHPLAEARRYGEMLHEELEKVIPSFIRRVRGPERGEAWSEDLADRRTALAAVADVHGLTGDAPTPGEPGGEAVRLVDWDPDGETKVAAACIYPHSHLSDADLLRRVRDLPADARAAILAAAAGERANRRHKPGRGFERTEYRFDIVADYGAFRDLQRHRLLTVEWQELTPELGFDVPELVREAGLEEPYVTSLQRSADLHARLTQAGFTREAAYAVALAYRIRFVLQLNAREAFHVIELRSSAQGHASYRRVAHEMHRLVGEVHPAIAGAMTHVDTSEVDLERLEAERRSERRRAAAETAP